jgi:SAM-dependent methyltransferase
MSSSEYILPAGAEEFRRLRIQAEALALEAEVMLDRIGIREGWRCAELGCGAGGIVDSLSRRVGPAGRVIGLDQQQSSLDAARRWLDGLAGNFGNVSFQRGGILANELPAESFDFAHLRFVLTTVGQHEAMIAAAARLLKPGGIMALQEGSGIGIDCFPAHDAFYRLRELLFTVFAEVGDVSAGPRAFGLLRRIGFEDVNIRPCQAGARSVDDMAAYLPDTVRSIRKALLDRGMIGAEELAETLAACEAHLRDPETISTHICVLQVWGRKPG